MRLLLISLIFASCAITLLPSYDAAIVQDVLSAKQSSDALYIKIKNSSNKSFTTYAADYAQVDAAITAIIVKQAMRPQGKSFVTLVTNVQKLFQQYEGEHKAKGSATNEQLTIYNKYLNDAWNIVINSENSLNR